MRLGKMIGLPYTVLSIAKRIIQEKKARPRPPSKKWEIERPKEEKNYGSSPRNDQCDEASGHELAKWQVALRRQQTVSMDEGVGFAIGL